ncbi:MAG: flagellar export chaperone FlgN [Rhodoferax sp.]
MATAVSADAARPELRKARELARQLAQTLDLEFEALRRQDLTQFEQLQPPKSELLSQLTVFAGVVSSAADPAQAAQADAADWQQWRDAMAQCRDQHRRNAVLIERQLDAVRGTLQSLRLQDSPHPVEMYDRLGNIARSAHGQGYSDA